MLFQYENKKSNVPGRFGAKVVARSIDRPATFGSSAIPICAKRGNEKGVCFNNE